MMTSNGQHYFSGPPTFGDEESAAAYRRRCEKTRAKQTMRFAVAPGIRGLPLPPDAHVAKPSATTMTAMLLA